MSRRIRVAAATAVLLAAAAAPSLAGERDPPPRLEVLGRQLQLHGAGLRSVAWLEIYHCALYLPFGAAPPEQADPDGPIAFRVLVLDQDDDEELPDEWREALAAEVSDKILNRMRQAYETAEPGDVMVVGHVPGRGTIVTRNGEAFLRTRDPGLIQVVTAQWLGRDPVSHDLRRALLDGRTARRSGGGDAPGPGTRDPGR